MKILFIDSSAKLASVFVTDEETILGSGFDSGEKTHASMLIPLVDKALSEAGLKISDVDVIAAANGPGSYTGLRIALACAKMLAYGSKKPLVTVNSLDYVARSVQDYSDGRGEGSAGGLILAMMDARNTLCFYSIYQNDGNGSLRNLTGVRSDYTADIISKVRETGLSGNGVTVCGDGALKNREMLEEGLSNPLFPETGDITGNHAGAARTVKEKIEKAGDLSSFLPEKASAEYFKEVHITLRSAADGK